MLLTIPGDPMAVDGSRPALPVRRPRRPRALTAVAAAGAVAKGPPRAFLTTPSGALFGVLASTCLVEAMAFVGFDWMTTAGLPGAFEIATLALQLTVLLGSLVNLVAVVVGCWD